MSTIDYTPTPTNLDIARGESIRLRGMGMARDAFVTFIRGDAVSVTVRDRAGVITYSRRSFIVLSADGRTVLSSPNR